ncbi:ribosome biogenesis GTPase Der [Gimesia sp.]|uniref:ribosome biogenesis GTPase Der n=1 Tax=Gimesia sp. TaxID=2024833 RepID=UPI000C53A7B6|nr:ribosome biogenesis GTPase Der [Gimesia sp.]MAX36110.1 ribosome biogenesis GTPase Der [Gimesia sp.]HBL45204.1 ribosome biogenesis GTPase Der [Planctomycetaceae bacterium]|tara:strand:+ start:8187 stop:9620 length:1434 start_codon:yes stop_codon:yes gene_type:complete
MAIPKIAIVGRPNVGKSSIFNWLAGHRVAIVDPTAGVTRDRVTYLVHEKDRYFELVDTGGIGITDSDDLSEDIERQIQVGIDEADLILFVVDGSLGVAHLDEEVATRLRLIEKPKILCINKCDSTKTDDEAAQFYHLTNSPVVLTSVKGNRNRNELLDEIMDQLPPAEELEESEGDSLSADPELKIAIVGRRNVGKSTFINALAESERMIVSEVAGTTRDSVDIRFEFDDKSFLAIDTPGVRKRKSLANDIEFYGLTRAKRSIRRANVVLMFFDSQETVSKVDKQLVAEIEENHKPCIFVINKWDLGREKKMTSEKWDEYLTSQFRTMRHAPVAFVTAKDSRNIKQVINLAQTIYKQSRIRVSTGRLNKIVRAAIQNNQPPYSKNHRPKIYYATQVATEPPTIVLKCNDQKLFTDSWKRYLSGVLREALPFKEIPIKIYYRPKDAKDESSPSLDMVEQEDFEVFSPNEHRNQKGDTV